MDRAQVDRSKQDVLTSVTDIKLDSYGTVSALSGIWSTCSDFGGQVRYAVKGRLDDAAGSADRLLAALQSAGWTAAYSRGESPRRRGVQRDGLSLEVTDYADADFVLVDVLGECLATGQDLADSLRKEARTDLR